MKKLFCLLFACALCSAFALTACSNNASSSASSSASPGSDSAASSSSEPAATELAQADIEKMIVGTWVLADVEGEPALTGDKAVFNFLSDTKARVSTQFELTPEGPLTWASYYDADVAISGDKVTVTDHPSENATAVSELTITAINSDEFTANHVLTLTVDGVDRSIEGVCRYVKVDADFSESILGTWEGISPIDDSSEFRCEYKDDGTYVYYVKDGDKWELGNDTLNEYYVAGNLLCTRWMENGQESRDCWEIGIDGDTMSWTALRAGDDGKTFTKSLELTKVA